MLTKILLSDLKEINIIGGQIISRVEAKDESEKQDTIKVLVPKAISNGVINADALETLDLKTTIDSKRITKEGDIIVKLTTPYGACLIDKENEGLLVPSFCVIINNVPEHIMKEYLVAFLNSKTCLMQIKSLVTGLSIPLLSSGQIKKFTIPLPETSIQKEISETYFESLEKIKLLEKITKLEKEYLDSKFVEMESNDGRK